MVEGWNRNKYREAQNWMNQEPKPGTLFLVGSWLRPYNFGFGRTLPRMPKDIFQQPWKYRFIFKKTFSKITEV